MLDPKPNSHKFKETQKEHRVNAVVTTEAKIKRKTAFNRIKDSFFTTDKNTIKDYIIDDLIIPFCKKSILELVSMILYNNPNAKGTAAQNGPKIVYGGFVNGVKSNAQINESPRKKSLASFDFDKLSFESRGDAEIVLDEMYKALQTFDEVRVLDLYDLARVGNDSPSASKYGWTDLTGSQVVRGFDGYYRLKLPDIKLLVK